MQCTSCGFAASYDIVGAKRQCNSCGGHFIFDTDDFLVHQYGAPGRDIRGGQIDMGRLVEKAIRDHAIAVVEAPVGSGKSDAYGVPAILSVASGAPNLLKNYKGYKPEMIASRPEFQSRVIISTAKKALQRQLAEKDLPFIRNRLGDKTITVGQLKGKSNFACRLRAETVLAPREREEFFKWMDKNPEEDLTLFAGKRPPYLYDVTAEDCLGRMCSYSKPDAGGHIPCGYARARADAMKARVIVTNHHMVAYDLQFGPGTVLGPYSTLILDEAHQAPSSFRAAFSSHLTEAGHRRLVRQLDSAGIGGTYADRLSAAWAAMFSGFELLSGEIPKDPFGAAGDATLGVLVEIQAAVQTAMNSLGWADSGYNLDAIRDYSDRSTILHLLALSRTVSRTIQPVTASKNPDSNTVLYAGKTPGNFKMLTLAPITVGKLIGYKLQMLPSLVVTSATMAVNKTFDDIKFQLGLNWASYKDGEGRPIPTKQIHELTLESPFNYSEQALLYTPTHIPLPALVDSPERPRYVAAIAAECSRLIQASNGNAFILFTSRQDLQEVYEVLDSYGLPNPLIIQEDDAGSTFTSFMSTPNSVLLGVKSFWEGVDVQGQKLQLVIVVKLPFPSATDPVLQARARQLVADQVAKGVAPQTAQQSVFNRLQIPYMLTELRQGAGRLIRAKTDTGVLAVLDTRVFTGDSKSLPTPGQTTYRGYGKAAVEAIGFPNRVTDFQVVSRVFAHWAAKSK